MSITIATSFTEQRLEPENVLQNTALPPKIPVTCKSHFALPLLASLSLTPK